MRWVRRCSKPSSRPRRRRRDDSVRWNAAFRRRQAYGGQAAPDLILITHEHGDHYDPETLAAIAGDQTRLITNPAVADAMLRTPRRIYILGVASGQTDAVFFDASGRRILSLNVRVDQDTGALADTINRVLPGSRVTIEAVDQVYYFSTLGLWERAGIFWRRGGVRASARLAGFAKSAAKRLARRAP